ncbi:hypothetical protein [Acrocarpospora corrugata]|nr:hypothetical protein [Acrocarpospora corrugata]
MHGTLRFGRSGPLAVEFTRGEIAEKGEEPSPSELPHIDKYIIDGSRYYDSADNFLGTIPDGKTWVHRKGSFILAYFSHQPFDVFNPAVISVLLKNRTPTRVPTGYLYRGTTPSSPLDKATRDSTRGTDQMPFDLPGGGPDISWRLWTDLNGLPQRLMTSFTVGAGKYAITGIADTRYSGWGSPVDISAPPTDQVIEEADVPADVLRNLSYTEPPVSVAPAR